jgi:hypothetical protein
MPFVSAVPLWKGLLSSQTSIPREDFEKYFLFPLSCPESRPLASWKCIQDASEFLTPVVRTGLVTLADD